MGLAATRLRLLHFYAARGNWEDDAVLPHHKNRTQRQTHHDFRAKLAPRHEQLHNDVRKLEKRYWNSRRIGSFRNDFCRQTLRCCFNQQNKRVKKLFIFLFSAILWQFLSTFVGCLYWQYWPTAFYKTMIKETLIKFSMKTKKKYSLLCLQIRKCRIFLRNLFIEEHHFWTENKEQVLASWFHIISC